MLAGAVVAALAGVPTQAQPNPAQTDTGPDYNQVSDFLNGHRSLLKVQDLAIFAANGAPALYRSYVQTANSQQTQAAGVTQFNFGGGWAGVEGSFAALMFNKGYETAVAISRSNGIPTLLLANGYDGNDWSVYYPVNPTSAAVQSKVATDFTGDGFEDLALNLSDHRLVMATPTDVNNTRSAMREIVSPTSKFYDMVAGDFNGDGHPELAGLTILPGGGLQLQILTVDPKTLTVTLTSSLNLNTPQTPIAKVSFGPRPV